MLKGSEISIHPITLYPGINILKSNRGSRKLTKWELNRIDKLHEMNISKSEFSKVIDTSQLSIRETVDYLCEEITNIQNQNDE